LVRRDLDVITRDYRSHASPEAAFSGIIARDFFADGLLIIDYRARTLSFSRTLALPSNGRNILRYERAFRVPVSIGELQTEGNLDTGANVAFALPRTLYDRVATGPLQQAERGRLTNTQIETGRATVHGPFGIGEATLSNVDVRVSDRLPEMIVGAHALQDTVVMIDQRSRTVAVCK
jgi:predicted aspartyl protease